MITKKIETFELVLNKSEILNMSRVLLQYLDNFEKNTHEEDMYTKQSLLEILHVLDNKELSSKIEKDLDAIRTRCLER